MVCPTTPSGSGHSAEAQALVYNFVKRKKPELLLEMFGEERCQELQKRNHIYDRNSLLTMLEAVKGHLSVTKKDAPEDGEQKSHLTVKTEIKEESPIDDNEDVPKKKTMKITPELAVFNYFHERQQEGALKVLFNEKTREDYARKVESMGSLMPPIRRMYAHYRFVELKKENPLTLEIWQCELCKKNFKLHGHDLLWHIGTHEDIPCPCFIEGCDAILRTPTSLSKHLLRSHVLRVASMNSQQYHALKKTGRQFCRRAKTFRDKYFPPEAFIGFNDCKKRNSENSECRQCGRIASNDRDRRRHVTEHLKLSYKCIFEGCNYKEEPSRFAVHFNRKHKTKVGDLSEEQLFKHKQIKLDFEGTAQLNRRTFLRKLYCFRWFFLFQS
uniref:C2H2-type domain-containing protein n=1 Tax=Steinernema glaseri TaxID=37863 RepID=A0A1I7YEP5_9BILA